MKSNAGDLILSEREKRVITDLYLNYQLTYGQLGRLFHKAPESIKRAILSYLKSEGA